MNESKQFPNLNNIFTNKLYPTNDWKKVLSLLKKKTKNELIDYIDMILLESYKGVAPYPNHGCDFASDFGYIVFRDLGYNVKVQIFQHPVVGEHNFLLVENEAIDFTSKQFDESLSIRNIDLESIHYKNSHEHIERSRVLSEGGYEWFLNEANAETLTGIMNYVPFSYIINAMLYTKTKK